MHGQTKLPMTDESVQPQTTFVLFFRPHVFFLSLAFTLSVHGDMSSGERSRRGQINHGLVGVRQLKHLVKVRKDSWPTV